MSPHNENNRENSVWTAWVAVQKTALKLSQAGNHEEAINRLNNFLSSDMDDEIRSDVLGFRASLWEERSDFGQAKADLLQARSLLKKPTYGRYVHEVSLGSISERLQSPQEAKHWYEVAMNSCLQGHHISGGTVLKRYIDLVGEKQLAAKERQTCEDVVRHSLSIFGVQDPNVTHLLSAVERIRELEARPRRST